MILVFIFLFLFLGFIFSRISVNVENFNLVNNLDKFDTRFNIKLKFKLYNMIPIFIINLKEDGMRILGIKIDYKKFKENEKFKRGLKQAKRNFKISSVKFLKPNLEKINLKLSFGTESVVITSFLVTLASVLLSFLFKNSIKKFDKDKYKYIIKPRYGDENKIYLEFKGIFHLKTSNIIECMKYN